MKKTELENLQNIISCFCGKTTKKNNDCDGSHWACVGDFLLSKKTNAKRVMIAFDKLTNPVNCFLATCYEVFNKVDSLKYIKTKNTVLYLNVFKSQFNNSKKTIYWIG